jgi:hypothetical protein
MLTPDITIGRVMFTPAYAMSTWSAQFNHLTWIWQETRKEDMNPLTGKVQRRGTFDGYEVAGWRNSDHPSWNVKARLAGCPRDWFGYTVTVGMFELTMFTHAQREAVLHAIGTWEAELMDPNVRNDPFDHSRSQANIYVM